jgi:hypothetical protein
MELRLKIRLIRARLRFLNEPKGVSHLGCQKISHQLRPPDLHVVQQAQLPAFLNMRPGEELRAITKKETRP